MVLTTGRNLLKYNSYKSNIYLFVSILVISVGTYVISHIYFLWQFTILVYLSLCQMYFIVGLGRLCIVLEYAIIFNTSLLKPRHVMRYLFVALRVFLLKICSTLVLYFSCARPFQISFFLSNVIKAMICKYGDIYS